jgi:hypothetical protein
MSHLHILSEVQTEAINGGFWSGYKTPSTSTATNLAYMPQTNSLVAVPVATGGVGLLGLATGGVAGVLAGQRNFGVILQSAEA